MNFSFGSWLYIMPFVFPLTSASQLSLEEHCCKIYPYDKIKEMQNIDQNLVAQYEKHTV